MNEAGRIAGLRRRHAKNPIDRPTGASDAARFREGLKRNPVQEEKKKRTPAPVPAPAPVLGTFRVPLAIRECAAFGARALDAKWIPGLRSKHAWFDSKREETGLKSPTLYRGSSEIFASAKVLCSRLRWVADGAAAAPETETGPSISRARVMGRVAQISLDVFLGFIIRRFLVTNAETITALASGSERFPTRWSGRDAVFGVSNKSSSTRRGKEVNHSPTPPLGESVRRNAEWLMRGSPLGIKLHRPLARALGACAALLVEALGQVVATESFRRGIKTALVCVAHAGVFGGASLSLALAADVITFLTTHVAALHVYSSLLVTAQWHFSKKLVRILGSAADSKRNAGEDSDEKNGSSFSQLESTTFGVLALTPLSLLFPTTFAFYLSYLALHAFVVFVRACLVFSAAAVQHFPLEKLLARALLPDAFPGKIDVVVGPSRDTRTTAGRSIVPAWGSWNPRVHANHAPLHLRCSPVSAFEYALRPFAAAAAEWSGVFFSAVAAACSSLGRLPVALTPFQPEDPERGFET
jgi:phosphatidylinositol glycan class Q protein